MKIVRKSVLLAGCAALGACGGGGGGGGVTSTPAPVPAPTPAPAPVPSPTPTPASTNTRISNLVASQTFSEQTSTTDVSIQTADGFVQSTSTESVPLTISYDAADGSYTVSTAGRTLRVTPSDELAQRWDGERRFSNSGDYLTLVTNPYLGAQYSNKFVGMGYWQRNSISGAVQQTYFSTFTYGLDTPGSEVPRSGAASWLTDVFGLLTIPGKELRIVQGLGDFSVDFEDGTFVSTAYLNEAYVVTNDGTNGSLRFSAGGYLDSSNGFSGLFSYNGIDTSLTGTLTGSFYGPNANEIGAVFSANGGGNALTGALTGQQLNVGSTSDGIQNVSLTNLLADDRFYGDTIQLQWTETEGETGYSSVVHGASSGNVDVSMADGILGVGFDRGAYTRNSADLDPSGPANFDTYNSTWNGKPLTVSFYKIGKANSEVALTYASLVIWETSEDGAIPTGQTTNTTYRQYLVYGLPSDVEVMAGRSGSAEYAGSVYGTAADMRGNSWHVGGTSSFSVDFSAEAYDGSLKLSGNDATGAPKDFGQWLFNGTLNLGGMISSSLTGPRPSIDGGTISPIFYGPSGQEIGATFSASVGGVAPEDAIEMVGVTVAKQQ